MKLCYELIVDASPEMGWKSIDHVQETIDEIVRDNDLDGFSLQVRLIHAFEDEKQDG